LFAHVGCRGHPTKRKKTIGFAAKRVGSSRSPRTCGLTSPLPLTLRESGHQGTSIQGARVSDSLFAPVGCHGHVLARTKTGGNAAQRVGSSRSPRTCGLTSPLPSTLRDVGYQGPSFEGAKVLDSLCAHVVRGGAPLTRNQTIGRVARHASSSRWPCACGTTRVLTPGMNGDFRRTMTSRTTAPGVKHADTEIARSRAIPCRLPRGARRVLVLRFNHVCP